MPSNYPKPEKYHTIPAASRLLGFKPDLLRRAVRSGLINAYQPLGSRRYVRLSEIEQAIAASKVGGRNNG